MTRLNSSSTTAIETNNAVASSAQTKMVWSFSWEFDYSPAAEADVHSPRDTQNRTGADELGYVLDKALAYAG
jgi:hypothetical protein